jgi:uncharacterized iron-regulated membrane protein
MGNTKKRSLNIRSIHRTIAPIMLLPLLLTAVTGVIYQIFDLAGNGKTTKWLLDWHKGDFGILNLEVIYPFLNALGLIVLLFSGFYMWEQMESKKQFKDNK